jgi:hypothetical protein
VKLNLLLDEAKPLSGYVNVSPLIDGNPEIVKSDVTNLDAVCDDAEADEILISTEVLPYFPSKDAGNIMQHWCRKLRRGGTITMYGQDLYLACKAILTRQYSTAEANKILYGGEKGWNIKKTAFSILDVEQLFSQVEFKIIRKSIHGINFTITAQRPV